MFDRLGRLIVVSGEDRRARVAFIILIFLFFGSADFLVEWALTSAKLNLAVHGSVDAIIVGGIAALLSWFLFEAGGKERARVRAHLEEDARLNHEIRNALEVIGQAGYMISDVRLKTVVSDSVKRIDSILRRRTSSDK